MAPCIGASADGLQPPFFCTGADVYQCTTQGDGTAGIVVARHVSTSLRVPVTYATQHVSGVGTRSKPIAVPCP